MCPCRMGLKTLPIFATLMKFFPPLSAFVRTLSSISQASILWLPMFSAVSHSPMKDSSRATAEFLLPRFSFGAPFVLTSGGGYSKPIERSAEAHANTYRTAWEMFASV